MRILCIIWIFLISHGYAMAADTWTSIKGIPEPPFGITTSHEMYSNEKYTYDYGSGPEPYRIGPNGPYTHFVMPTHPKATDKNNPYGTVEKPRVTCPDRMSGRPMYGPPLPPGSVVEIHKGTRGIMGSVKISGTKALPIFIRGIKGDEPIFHGALFLRGSHIVLENIRFDMEQSSKKAVYIGRFDDGPIKNIAVRNCEFYNGQYDPSESYQIIRIKNAHSKPYLIRNIVLYKNHFHHIGDGRTTTVKKDAVGISIDANISHAWIIGNRFNHIGGDGIQIAWDSFVKSTDMPQYIYIGKNTAHDCYENFLDLKMCQDVIVSENNVFNFGEGYGKVYGKTSIPFRYGSGAGPAGAARNNIWTLFNVVYNYNSADGGFLSYTKKNQTRSDEIYYIGNIAYNSHNEKGNSAGFYSSGQNRVYWINNTAYNCDRAGVFIGDHYGNAPDERLTLINNIFGNIGSDSKKSHNLMIGAVQASLDRAVVKNNIFHSSKGRSKFRVGIYKQTGPAAWKLYLSHSSFSRKYPSFGAGLMGADPRHIDAVNADFRLSSDSPAIDGGGAHGAYDRFKARYGLSIKLDHDNKPVPNGSAQDIGAYEY